MDLAELLPYISRMFETRREYHGPRLDNTSMVLDMSE
jgi:hypothetical protein